MSKLDEKMMSDIDDCMVVAFCVNGKIVFIVSGRSDELYDGSVTNF